MSFGTLDYTCALHGFSPQRIEWKAETLKGGLPQ
jgi:hypothetical protein